MGAPDPQAAAAGWISRIPAAQRAAAHALTDARLANWLLVAIALVVLSAAIARFDLMGRLRRAVEARGPRPWLASAASAVALALPLSLARALIDAVDAWRSDAIAASVGWASPAGLGAHLASALRTVPPTLIWAVALIPPLQWLTRRSPRWWPAIAGAAFTATVFGLVWLPYALSLGPPLPAAAPTPARDGVAQLLVQAGLGAPPILVSPDPTFDADVTGAFGRAKVTLGPALAAGPPAEARAYVGHLVAHYLHGDILAVCVLLSITAGLGFTAVKLWTPWLARRLGARAERPTDPEALPAMAIIGLVTLAVGGLAVAAYLRWANVRADAYALDLARTPDGLAAVLIREWDHQSTDPGPLPTALFYTHPPLGSRLDHAMRWKAANGG